MTRRVGTFRHFVEIAAAEVGPFAAVDVLVDTGATYSVFPRVLLDRLGVTPHDRAEFELADGRTIVRELATIVARLDGRTRHILCIVGEDGVEPLLGATTLELFGLAADPVNQRLVRARLYLKATRPPHGSKSRAGRGCGSDGVLPSLAAGSPPPPD